MTAKQSAKILKDFNEWRRNDAPAYVSMPCQKKIGQAIDVAVEVLSKNQSKPKDLDIEYVKADEVRKALGGHENSELFGENGLIAATMRCVDALGSIYEKTHK